MRSLKLYNSLILASVLAVGACGGPKRTVERTDSKSTAGGDLSGYWNDIDANLVSSEMIKDCLGRPWASDFQTGHSGNKPVVKLMGVIKRTDDRNVNEQYFTKQLEKELLNSGRVRVVAGEGQENVNERERTRQAKHASDDTVKSHGNETGADFTLQTVVNSQNESDGSGKAVRAYLVNMELVNVETQEKVWIGEKAIRKVIEQAGTTW
jgi:PBP1b-binding outer membrane lipoprotein LpoB